MPKYTHLTSGLCEDSSVSDETPEVETAEPNTEIEQMRAELERLRQHHEKLLGETKQAKQKAKEEADERERIAQEAAKKNGDIEAIEKSWQAKLSKREQELADELAARDKWLDEMTVSRAATELAAELDYEGSSKLLMPLITPRLKRETRDGKPAIVVLDKEGKPSAATLDDLRKEFLADASLARFVKGSSATGGGAAGAKGGSRAPAKKGDLAAKGEARVSAIASMFPDLPRN